MNPSSSTGRGNKETRSFEMRSHSGATIEIPSRYIGGNFEPLSSSGTSSLSSDPPQDSPYKTGLGKLTIPSYYHQDRQKPPPSLPRSPMPMEPPTKWDNIINGPVFKVEGKPTDFSSRAVLHGVRPSTPRSISEVVKDPVTVHGLYRAQPVRLDSGYSEFDVEAKLINSRPPAKPVAKANRNDPWNYANKYIFKSTIEKSTVKQVTFKTASNNNQAGETDSFFEQQHHRIDVQLEQLNNRMRQIRGCHKKK